MKKTIFAISAPLALIGCAASGLSGSGPDRAITASAAQQAAQQHPQLVAQFGGAVQGPVAQYVERVGRKVAAQSGIQGAGQNAFTFTVLNSPVPNAFAVPGGYVYVTRGLLALANSEAELAFVLAHEIGHVTADHSKARRDRNILTQLGAAAAGILTGSGELAQTAGQIGQGFFLSYSRDQEFESDALAVRYAAAAGYDVNAGANLLTSLGRVSELENLVQGRNETRAVPAWARTHPLSQDRVARVVALANELQLPGIGALNSQDYLARIDGLLFGDDPRQGVLEDGRFLHPELRLRFDVPRGYELQNTVRAVAITGPGGQAQFSTGAFAGDLGSYIERVFQGLTGGQTQLNIPAPRTTTINGIPAAYTTASFNTQQGLVDVSVIAYRWDANTAYHLVTVTPAGQGFGPFESLVRSVGRLSAAEAATVRPRMIDVVTVKPGDTVQSLSRRLAFDEFQLDRFLVLNSLTADTRLVPGSEVKIVVYGNR